MMRRLACVCLIAGALPMAAPVVALAASTGSTGSAGSAGSGQVRRGRLARPARRSFRPGTAAAARSRRRCRQVRRRRRPPRFRPWRRRRRPATARCPAGRRSRSHSAPRSSSAGSRCSSGVMRGGGPRCGRGRVASGVWTARRGDRRRSRSRASCHRPSASGVSGARLGSGGFGSAGGPRVVESGTGGKRHRGGEGSALGGASLCAFRVAPAPGPRASGVRGGAKLPDRAARIRRTRIAVRIGSKCTVSASFSPQIRSAWASLVTFLRDPRCRAVELPAGV